MVELFDEDIRLNVHLDDDASKLYRKLMRISKAHVLLAVGVLTSALHLVASAPGAEATVSPYSAGYLLNGSFEAESGWENFYDGADPSGRSSSNAHHGDFSLEITDTSALEAEGWRSLPIDIVSGASYSTSAWMYTDSGQAPHLYLKFYDAGDSEVGSASVAGPTGHDVWQLATLTGNAPTDAVSARVVLISISNRVTESYVDAVSFGRSASQSLIGNEDFELDSLHVSMPNHWSHYSGTSQPVSVELDPDDAGNQVLELIDDSATLGTNVATEFTAAPGEAHGVSMALRRASGSDAVHVWIRYYDRDGNELSSSSESTDTSAGSWETYVTTTYAPSQSTHGRVVVGCISNRKCETYLDEVEVELAWQETYYLSSVAAGSEDGSSPANAASYLDPDVWDDVDSDLSSSTVNVILLDGTYSVDDEADRFVLEGIGSTTRRLLISGESAYGVVFSLDDDIEEAGVILIDPAENVTLTDFHITSSGSYSIGSALLVRADPNTSETTRSIHIRNFSISDMPGVEYSGIGVGATVIAEGVFDVSIQGGTLTRAGSTSGYHHLYITRAASGTDISGNLIEDSAGTYVKLRDMLSGVEVDANYFYSTGTWYNNVQFVQLAVYNDVDPGDEWFGDGYSITNNHFEHKASWCDPDCKLFNITHRGYNPVDDDMIERDHLLDASKKAELEDTDPSNSEDRLDVIESSFFLEIGNCDSFCVSGNTMVGVDDYFNLFTTHQFGATSQGGSGNYDITNLTSY